MALMYRIGEFSRMAKVPLTTLRYYDEAGLLKPKGVDPVTRYRLYAVEQLTELCMITKYRRVGLTIDEIRRILDGEDPVPMLEERIRTSKEEVESIRERISILESLLSEKNDVVPEVEVKELPALTTAYRSGRIPDQSYMNGFVLEFAGICNLEFPDLQCTEDGYCFITYDDPEYREEDIGLTYHQAVLEVREPSEEIGFMTFDPVMAACIKHVGPYSRMAETYLIINEWMEINGIEPSDTPRECYIHGCWDTEFEDAYLTEIQFPIKYKG